MNNCPGAPKKKGGVKRQQEEPCTDMFTRPRPRRPKTGATPLPTPIPISGGLEQATPPQATPAPRSVVPLPVLSPSQGHLTGVPPHLYEVTNFRPLLTLAGALTLTPTKSTVRDLTAVMKRNPTKKMVAPRPGTPRHQPRFGVSEPHEMALSLTGSIPPRYNPCQKLMSKLIDDPAYLWLDYFGIVDVRHQRDDKKQHKDVGELLEALSKEIVTKNTGKYVGAFTYMDVKTCEEFGLRKEDYMKWRIVHQTLGGSETNMIGCDGIVPKICNDKRLRCMVLLEGWRLVPESRFKFGACWVRDDPRPEAVPPASDDVDVNISHMSHMYGAMSLDETTSPVVQTANRNKSPKTGGVACTPLKTGRLTATFTLCDTPYGRHMAPTLELVEFEKQDLVVMHKSISQLLDGPATTDETASHAWKTAQEINVRIRRTETQGRGDCLLGTVKKGSRSFGMTKNLRSKSKKNS